MPTLTEDAIEAEIVAKGKTAPRITPAHIDAQIAAEYTFRADHALRDCPVHDALKSVTLCVMVLKNGFVVEGISACGDPANFDEEIGRKLARENARNKIWQLEGYQLRSRLAGLI